MKQQKANGLNTKKYMSKHIINKPLKHKVKEKILKVTRENIKSKQRKL